MDILSRRRMLLYCSRSVDLPVEPESLAPSIRRRRKARTFALLRHLILHAAQRQPLVLAVENLHWSDATSEEWLASLVERLAGAALLLLVTYRPGYQPPLGSALRRHAIGVTAVAPSRQLGGPGGDLAEHAAPRGHFSRSRGQAGG